MKTLLFFLLVIIQAIITIIPYQGKLSDNRKKFPYNFTKRGWVLVTSCAITIFLTVILFLISEKEGENKDEALRRAVSNATLEAGAKYSALLDSTSKNTIELLARYGLHYDSTHNSIVKLVKDSMIKDEMPFLELQDGNFVDFYHHLDTMKFRYALLNNSKSPAYNLKLGYVVIWKSNDKFKFTIGNSDMFPQHPTVSSLGFSSLINLYGYEMQAADTLFLLMYGNYTNYRKDKTGKFIDLLLLDVRKKWSSHFDYRFHPQVHSFIKQQRLE